MPTETEVRTYVEQSRDGVLTVSLDSRGTVAVQLEPEVNQTWSAEMLSKRIFHLYTLAQMRARCDERLRMNERGMDMAPSEVFPAAGEIAQYRARFIDF
jgi:hypothetical protein